MPYSVPIQYADLFEFLEDYRANVGQLSYTVPATQPLMPGEEVAIQFMVPVLEEVVTVFGRVTSPMGEFAAVQLDGQGDGVARLEGFYRFVGKLVESLLYSGRFKVSGQWAEGARPAVSGSARAAAARAGAGAPAGPGQAPSAGDLGAAAWTSGVDEKSLTDAMMRVYRERATGVLEISSEGGRRLGWCKQGGFVQWQNDPVIQEECLGVLLAGAGRLTEEQLKQSLRIMNETGQKQGQALIQMGVLTFPQLVMALMTQVEIVTRNVFKMTSGRLAFYSVREVSSDFIAPPMKAPGFLFGHYKKRYGGMRPEQLQAMQEPLLDRYTTLAGDVNWDDMRLKKEERALVEILLKKSYRFREVFSVSTMGRNPTLLVLLALIELAALQFVSAEQSTQIVDRWRKQLEQKLAFQAEQNPFEVLEAHWTSRSPQVEAAYKRLRLEYERFGRGATLPEDIEEKRQQILKNMDGAYAKLKDAASRAEVRRAHYEPQQHEFSADLLFRQGEMLMVREKWEEVIDNFERACELMPNIVKYKQFLTIAKKRASGIHVDAGELSVED